MPIFSRVILASWYVDVGRPLSSHIERSVRRFQRQKLCNYLVFSHWRLMFFPQVQIVPPSNIAQRGAF